MQSEVAHVVGDEKGTGACRIASGRQMEGA
jgi:hypothetical protein